MTRKTRSLIALKRNASKTSNPSRKSGRRRENWTKTSASKTISPTLSFPSANLVVVVVAVVGVFVRDGIHSDADYNSTRVGVVVVVVVVVVRIFTMG